MWLYRVNPRNNAVDFVAILKYYIFISRGITVYINLLSHKKRAPTTTNNDVFLWGGKNPVQPSVKTRRCSGAESGQREVRAGHNVADLDYYISTAVHQHVLHYTIVVKNKAQCFLLQCNSHDKRVFTAKKRR